MIETPDQNHQRLWSSRKCIFPMLIFLVLVECLALCVLSFCRLSCTYDHNAIGIRFNELCGHVFINTFNQGGLRESNILHLHSTLVHTYL